MRQMVSLRRQILPTAKILMLGDSAQGKSAIVIRFVTENFVDVHDPTIEDLYQKIYVYEDEAMILEILDTAGGDEYQRTLGESWIRESEIFILVYAIDSEYSLTGTATPFEQCSTWRDKILQIKQREQQHIPIILVGNKSDIDDEKRSIPKYKGEQVSNEWGCPFIEVSAKTGDNLDDLWDLAIREYKTKHIDFQEASFIPDRIVDDDQKRERNINICDCNCFKPKQRAIELKQEEIKWEGEKVKLYDVIILPKDDTFEPIISSKNFQLLRRFDLKRFIKMLLCGLFLPIIILFQTLIFWLYSENEKEDRCYYKKMYPYNWKYDDIHYWIFLDFLGLIIGRAPNQDPETLKNRKWFLRQTTKQLWYRMIIMIIIVILFYFLWYNVCQINNDELIGVSNMETLGIFILFWAIWILLSLWIAYKTDLNPSLPLLAKLRSIDLYFGKYLNKTSSAYKIIRGYLYSVNKYWTVPWLQRITIFCVAFFYSLIPGITRSWIIEGQGFITSNSGLVEIGALFVNFILISVLMYIIEVQYSKHFDNYWKWMYLLTMILNENQMETETETEQTYFNELLFLSLKRKSNALGWLETRSCLAIKGKMFFCEQELPILWILLITTALTAFTVYRVYFISGNPLQSIVFNGVVFLTIICLISLMRISSTSFKFKSLQWTQEKYIGQQKFFIKCRKNIYNNNQYGKPQTFNHVNSKIHSIHEMEEEEEEYGKPKIYTLPETEQEDEDDIDNDNIDDDYDEDLESKQTEIEPLIKENIKDESQISVNNGHFLEDMLYVITKNDINPRVFDVQLSTVLGRSIILLSLSIVFIVFKIFLNEYSLESVERIHEV